MTVVPVGTFKINIENCNAMLLSLFKARLLRRKNVEMVLFIKRKHAKSYILHFEVIFALK